MDSHHSDNTGIPEIAEATEAVQATGAMQATEAAEPVQSEESEETCHPVHLPSVFPAKIFSDLQRGSENASEDANKRLYDVVKRVRLYDAKGGATWDFTLPDGLFIWGSEKLSEGLSRDEANEDALRKTYDLLLGLKSRGFQPRVTHEVKEDGCIYLRARFDQKSYFTMRVMPSERRYVSPKATTEATEDAEA